MWALGVEDDAVRKCVTRGAPCLGRDKNPYGRRRLGGCHGIPLDAFFYFFLEISIKEVLGRSREGYEASASIFGSRSSDRSGTIVFRREASETLRWRSEEHTSELQS